MSLGHHAEAKQTGCGLSQHLYRPRSETSLVTALKKGHLQQSRSAIKPILTPKNQEDRMTYCRSFVETDGLFSDMMSHVDIDEKWFNLMEK